MRWSEHQNVEKLDARNAGDTVYRLGRADVDRGRFGPKQGRAAHKGLAPDPRYARAGASPWRWAAGTCATGCAMREWLPRATHGARAPEHEVPAATFALVDG